MASDVVVGNVFDKNGTRTPIYRRVVAGYFRNLSQLLTEPMPARVLGALDGQVGVRPPAMDDGSVQPGVVAARPREEIVLRTPRARPVPPRES
ncbi:MAG: hypothetical protein HW375_712, partial [Anaerolineales bacterium]|nr:hypothetical protein [Anaerolineales bacterium]